MFVYGLLVKLRALTQEKKSIKVGLMMETQTHFTFSHHCWLKMLLIHPTCKRAFCEARIHKMRSFSLSTHPTTAISQFLNAPCASLFNVFLMCCLFFFFGVWREGKSHTRRAIRKFSQLHKITIKANENAALPLFMALLRGGLCGVRE